MAGKSQPRWTRGIFANAQSALNLRLALATFGLVTSLLLGALAVRAGYRVLAGVLLVLAVVAVVDLVVVQRRRVTRRREEPPGTRHSLFE